MCNRYRRSNARRSPAAAACTSSVSMASIGAGDMGFPRSGQAAIISPAWMRRAAKTFERVRRFSRSGGNQRGDHVFHVRIEFVVAEPGQAKGEVQLQEADVGGVGQPRPVERIG